MVPHSNNDNSEDTNDDNHNENVSVTFLMTSVKFDFIESKFR